MIALIGLPFSSRHRSLFAGDNSDPNHRRWGILELLFYIGGMLRNNSHLFFLLIAVIDLKLDVFPFERESQNCGVEGRISGSLNAVADLQ